MFQSAASAGCTFLHEAALGGLAGPAELQIIKAGLAESDGKMRLAGAIFYPKLADFRAVPGMTQGGGTDFFRVTGVKLVSDGSNQGLTAHRSRTGCCHHRWSG